MIGQWRSIRSCPTPLTIPCGLLLTGLLLTACTGSAGDGAVSTSSASTAAVPSTAAPVLLAVVPNLALAPEQCFAEVDSVVTTPSTVTTATSATDPAPTTATQASPEPTAPDTLPETTVAARPAAVAVVDCTSGHEGVVYAAFCLGTDEDSDGELTSVACPGDVDLRYPGDRNIRRAAARICLQRFEETFGESYASSALVAHEFTPNEGVWELGDHRVVCHTDVAEIE